MPFNCRKQTAFNDLSEILSFELSDGLKMYWQAAGKILEGSGINLAPPAAQYLSFEHNFFSALFLYSYQCAKLPREERVFYVALNQCLRGMVTGCDNLLDDEYKKTLETDLPEHGHRFRSVLDIMVSDRTLFALLLKMAQAHQLTSDQIQQASAASLKALGRSGCQEASEENGIDQILEPQAVLKSVHHFKTGLLFQCVWAIPLVLFPDKKKAARPILEALYKIGMGCQILDDLVDLHLDLKQRRHNYIAALILHQSGPCAKNQLQKARCRNHSKESFGIDEISDDAIAKAREVGQQKALEYLVAGMGALFREEHQDLIWPAIRFLAAKIGDFQLERPQ